MEDIDEWRLNETHAGGIKKALHAKPQSITWIRIMTPHEVLTQGFGNIVQLVVLMALIAIAVSALRAFIVPKLKGRIGEASVNYRTTRSLNDDEYHLLSDITLPTRNGTTQVDHVVVSRYGIFVVETKTYKGWIYGSERDANWTQVIFKNKQRFRNPVRQNYGHMKTLARITGVPERFFRPIVVFAGDCTFKTDMPDSVVYARDYVAHVRSFQEPVIQAGQIHTIIESIRAAAETVTPEQKKQHVRNIRRNRQPIHASAEAPDCPRCGKAMVMRTNRKDGTRFWGCPAFPKCRGTRAVA